MATGLDFRELRWKPAFRELIQAGGPVAFSAMAEEFDRLSAFLRAALAGSSQRVIEVAIEDGPPKFFDGDGALVTTQPNAAIEASDGVTPIPNNVSYHTRYTYQTINRYHTIFQGGVSDPDGNVSSGGGGTISVKIKDLSDSDIKSLNSAPVEIIKAPGADKALIVIQVMVSINIPTTAYSAAPTSSLQYGSTVSAADFTLRLTTTGERVYAGARNNLDITTISQVENENLEFTTSADVTGGASENKIRVIVLYKTISLA